MKRGVITLFSLATYFIISCNVNAKIEEIDDNQSTIIDPYSKLDWSNVVQVASCSHEHGTSQSAVDLLVKLGVKHIAFSNYYPSTPYYPLDDFFNVPQGIISSPNAEHHSMSPFGGLHCNGLGSFFESGSPLGSDPVGLNNNSWQYAFNKIIENLQYDDGGGVTINHPKWSRWVSHSEHPSVDDICQMLDYDNRVLGIEFYNSTCEYAFEEKVGWDLETWDSILKTGRRCWGFSVSDHRYDYRKERMSGLNILLCNEINEHECLKAYREGRFYGSIHNSSLKFNSISLINETLYASATDADYMFFVVDGVYSKIDGNNGSVTLPHDTIYARIEAHNAENSIFSNPIIINRAVNNN